MAPFAPAVQWYANHRNLKLVKRTCSCGNMSISIKVIWLEELKLSEKCFTRQNEYNSISGNGLGQLYLLSARHMNGFLCVLSKRTYPVNKFSYISFYEVGF